MLHGAYSRKYGTKRYYFGFKHPIFGEKIKVHFVMHCVT